MSVPRGRAFPFGNLVWPSTAGVHPVHLTFFEIKPQKSAPPVAGRFAKAVKTVQALASPGGEIALGHALLFDKPCSNHRVMSPSLCGSDPYPCGSLTYRTHYAVVILNISETPGFVNPGFVNFLQTVPQPSNAAISARNCRPYRSALLAPTPLTAWKARRSAGRVRAISRRVLSVNTT